MAQPFDPQNVTNIYTKTNNDSSEDFDDGFREGSGSGTSNNKRSVTHIFVSQHALAALAHGCKKPKFYIIFLEFIFWGRNELHFDNLKEVFAPKIIRNHKEVSVTHK